MDFMKKFLILLALFCVIGSAAAVSAEDLGNFDGGYAGYQNDDLGVSESQDAPESSDANSEDVATDYESNFVPDGTPEVLPADWGHMEHAAGEPDNETADGQNATNTTAPDTADSQQMNETVSGNVTSDESGNATGTTPQTMLSTGNPILALLAVGAVLGGSALIRRK